MKNKTVIIKCMAKDCNVNIEIILNKGWYLNSNNKRVYGYFKDNELSFCLEHKKQFNQALNEMKQSQSKENINSQLKETINNSVEKELSKYKENTN